MGYAFRVCKLRTRVCLRGLVGGWSGGGDHFLERYEYAHVRREYSKLKVVKE